MHPLPMNNRQRLGIALVLPWALATRLASAQQAVPAWTGPPASIATLGFGDGVALVGDTNGDDASDLLVAESEWLDCTPPAGCSAGRVHFFQGSCSELSSEPVWSFEADYASGSWLGWSIGEAGDVNGDGFADFFAAYHSSGPNVPDCPYAEIGDCLAEQEPQGRVLVWHGAEPVPSHLPQWSFFEDQCVPSNMMLDIAGGGDINGDGYSDLLISRDSVNGSIEQCSQFPRGEILVFTGGASGLPAVPSQIVLPTYGSDPDSRRFEAVAFAGDVNADGYDDVIAGSPSAWWDPDAPDYPGLVELYLGTTSGLATTPAWSVWGDMDNRRLGSLVSTAGDINADGFADLLVAVQGNWLVPGSVRVYLGSATGPAASPSWSVSLTIPLSIAAAGDVNADGFGDILVGAADGVARVYEGSSSGTLTAGWTKQGAGFEWWGHALSGAKDVNCDCIDDILVGEPLYDDDPGYPPEGQANLFLGESDGQFAPAMVGACGEQIFLSSGPPHWEDITPGFLPTGCGPHENDPCGAVWIVTQGPPDFAPGMRARFTLWEATAIPGIATNASRPDRLAEEPDYLYDFSDPEQALEARPCEEGSGSICTTPFFVDPEPGSNRSLAAAKIAVTDWGGQVVVKGKLLRASGATDKLLAPLEVPVDADDNLLPDAGWSWSDDVASGVVSDGAEDLLDAGSDADDLGVMLPTIPAGDGLAASDEYRGFFVKGLHRRTDPLHRDLFVINLRNQPHRESLSKLDLALHEIRFIEADHPLNETDNSQRINFNRVNGQGMDQRALRYIYEPCPCGSTTTLGCVTKRSPGNPEVEIRGEDCSDGPWRLPAETYALYVNPFTIRAATPPTKISTTTTDVVDEVAERMVALHELGHAVGLRDYIYTSIGPQPDPHPDCFPAYTDLLPPEPWRVPDRCGPSSVMVLNFGWARAGCKLPDQVSDPVGDLGVKDASPAGQCPNLLSYWDNLPVRTFHVRPHDHPTFDSYDKERIRLK